MPTGLDRSFRTTENRMLNSLPDRRRGRDGGAAATEGRVSKAADNERFAKIAAIWVTDLDIGSGKAEEDGVPCKRSFIVDGASDSWRRTEVAGRNHVAQPYRAHTERLRIRAPGRGGRLLFGLRLRGLSQPVHDACRGCRPDASHQTWNRLGGRVQPESLRGGQRCCRYR